MSQSGPLFFALTVTGLSILFLVPVTSGFWFLLVIVRVVYRGQALSQTWHWLTVIIAAQWAGLAVFQLALWMAGAPDVAYFAAIFSFGSAAALALFARHLPTTVPRPRHINFATWLGLALLPLAVLSMGLLFLNERLYDFVGY